MNSSRHDYMSDYVPSNMPRTRREQQALTDRVSNWLADYTMAEIDAPPTPRVSVAKKAAMKSMRQWPKDSKPFVSSTPVSVAKKAALISKRQWPLKTTPFASPSPAPRSFYSSRFQIQPKDSLRQIRRPTLVECPQLSEANTDEDEFSISTRQSRGQAYQPASIGQVNDLDDFTQAGPSFGDNWLDELDEQPTMELFSAINHDPRNMTLGSEVSRHSDLSWFGDENKIYRMPEGKKEVDVASEWFRQRCAPMGKITNDGNSDTSDAPDFGMIYYDPEQSPRKKEGKARPRMAALFGFAEP